MSQKEDNVEKNAEYTEQDLRLLGGRLAEQRRLRGWTQQESSRRTGIHASRLSRIERGTVWPGLAELVALVLVYRIGLDELVFGPGRADGQEEEEEILLRQIRQVAVAEDRAALIRFLRAALTGYRLTGDALPRKEKEVS